MINQWGLVSAIVILSSAAIAACGNTNPGGGTSSSSSSGVGGEAGQGGAGGAGGTGGAMGGNGGAGGGAGGSNAGLVPTNGAELFPWLQDGNYMGFAAESAQHPSTGPHGGNVRTFLNPILFDALTNNSTNFPVNSAAVKELWGNGSKLLGWAVFVKTQADSAGGNGFYWYEIYDTVDPTNPVADGNGVGLCSGCHSNGVDYYLSPFPLQ